MNLACAFVQRKKKRLPAEHKLRPRHSSPISHILLSEASRVERQEFDEAAPSYQICGVRIIVTLRESLHESRHIAHYTLVVTPTTTMREGKQFRKKKKT